MNRRAFLATTATVSCAAALTPLVAVAAESKPMPTARKLPRWRGFNLTQKVQAQRGGNPPFPESDFALLAEWGFDFVRLPLSYLCWATQEQPTKLRETELTHLEDAAELGRKHGVHVNLNLHRAPGYCVNPPKEPLDLWTDEKALDNCAFHWAHLTKRFKGVPNDRLTFNLLNEPANVSEKAYVHVATRLVKAIHTEDPQRLIIADGLRWGRDPVHGLAGLGIAQSTRGYDPIQVSHFRAGWVQGADKYAVPTWPLKLGNKVIDTEYLRRDRIMPWQELEKKDVGIHVGEWGAHNQTPHDVVQAWMRDQLSLWREAGWGWALWNLHGSFGVLDSGRADVKYENFRGSKLDREMLELLKTG